MIISVYCPGCCGTPCKLGETITIVFSGITICTNCYPDGPDSQKLASAMLNGSFTLTGPPDGLGPWTGTGGPYSLNVYIGDPACGGVPSVESSNAVIVVACSVGAGGEQNISIAMREDPSTNGVQFFDATGVVGDTFSNTDVCGVPFVGAAGGTATISAP